MANESTDEYDVVTSDHDEIREWVETWNGTPAERLGETRRDAPALVFGEPRSDTEPVEWEEFFEYLDAVGLALAHRVGDPDPDPDDGPPAYEFVPRGSDEEGTPDDADEPDQHLVDKTDDDVADNRSEVREREAEKTTNPDNHRDRRPFES